MTKNSNSKSEQALPRGLRESRKRNKERLRWRGHLYYRTYPEFTIAPAEHALYVDRINRALNSSKTWGDFRKAVPKEYDWVVADCEDCGRTRPADSDAFDRLAISGVDEGDYPPWLLQQALQWLPASAIIECVTIGQSMVSGDCPYVKDPDRLKEILESEGYVLEHRPDLDFH